MIEKLRNELAEYSEHVERLLMLTRSVERELPLGDDNGQVVTVAAARRDIAHVVKSAIATVPEEIDSLAEWCDEHEERANLSQTSAHTKAPQELDDQLTQRFAELLETHDWLTADEMLYRALADAGLISTIGVYRRELARRKGDQ